MGKDNKTFSYKPATETLEPLKIIPTKQIDVSSINTNYSEIDALSEKELIYKIKFEYDGDELKYAIEMLKNKFNKTI